ncbi:MAG: ABC transporter substrate-binding protein [Actinobacteria bacterium]|nr:MAG: ABC transporter substrate-binding protein [Actinomycetota bacterium]
MRRSPRSTRRLAAVALAASCAVIATVFTAGSPAAVDRVGARTAAHSCLVMTGSGDPAFTKNFNPYTATGLPSGTFVQGAFYEPLIVTGEGGLKPVPWLARTWKWSNGNRTLTLHLAHGVKWSDGQALTSTDVVYSILAGRQDKLMDRVGLTGAGNNITAVTARGKYTVVIRLKTPDSQFIAATVNRVFVVPKHVWAKVGDVANFTNSKPVSSGPFNVVKRFTSQDYVFGKNPHYWQKGRPKIRCLEYVQASSNDSALALIQSGQADWTHNFVPNVEKAYVAKDPKHYHAFYATTAYPISLVLDTTRYPYSLPAFRKALSLSIDRKTVSKLGEYGYAPPTDAIGLNGLFPQWVSNSAVKKQAKQMATFSPAAAKRMLTGAGFSYKGSKLIDPKGNAVRLDIHVISGWSDWVASNQIITRNLRDIGINSEVALEPDWGAWWPNASAGKFPTLLWQGGSQGSPYGYFYANMSRNAFIPAGEDATSTGNWEHFSHDGATKLLDQWKGTLNSARQKRIATQLEKIFLDQMPIVPLFIGPRWSTYSTKYFHCFDTPKNFFGDPIFTTFPDNILSFTRICPGGKSGG